MSKETSGLIFAILSPFFSSISTIFKSGAAKTLGPLPVVGIGGLIGGVLLLIIAAIRHERISVDKIKENLGDLKAIIFWRFLLGEIFMAIGLSQTSAIKAIFFTKIEPYFVLIFAWLFLKEKVKPYYFLLLSMHLFGAALLSTGGEFNIVGNAQIGDLFIIISMAFFAVSYKQGKDLATKLGPVSSSAISLLVASAVVLPFTFLLTPMSNLTTPSSGWTHLIVYVILFNVFALTLWFASLKYVKGWIASTLRYIGPVLGAPVAYFLFGDTLNLTQIIGALIILATSFVIALEHFKTSKTVEPIIGEG